MSLSYSEILDVINVNVPRIYFDLKLLFELRPISASLNEIKPLEPVAQQVSKVRSRCASPLRKMLPRRKRTQPLLITLTTASSVKWLLYLRLYSYLENEECLHCLYEWLMNVLDF